MYNGFSTYGLTIGEWQKNIARIDTYIDGDPTFNFAKTPRTPIIRLHSKETSYWMALWKHRMPVDLRTLALHKLKEFNYPEVSDLLLDVYKSSPHYSQRLHIMKLLKEYADENFIELLKQASNDPSGEIRREVMSCSGETGRNDLIPYIVDLYLNNYLSSDIVSCFTHASRLFNPELLKYYFSNAIGQSGISNKKAFYKRIENDINNSILFVRNIHSSLIDKNKEEAERLSYIKLLNDNPVPYLIDDALTVLKDKEESINIRITVAEAMGHYNLNVRKEEISDLCKKIMTEENIDPLLAEQLNKTINKL